MNHTIRFLCACTTSALTLYAAAASPLRPVPFSRDNLADFMSQGPSPAAPQDSATSGYKINFVKSAPQNNLRKGRATKAVVEVRDRNNKPVAGAVVLFLLPNSGPSGTFVGGAQSISVTTNAAGQAIANYTPNQLAGMFNLTANAQVNGAQVATTTVSQANLAAAAAGAAGGLSGTAIGVIAGVAAAAAVGIGVGLSGGGSSATPSTPAVTPPAPPSIRIGIGGPPVFGPRSTGSTN